MLVPFVRLGAVRQVRLARTATLTLAWICAAAPGVAAPQPSPRGEQDQPPEIVVTGSRPSPEEVRRQAMEFVRRAGVVTSQRPVARWIDPVCVKILGLTDAHARLVKARFRAVAQAAAVPFSTKPCRPNAVVSFATNSAEVVRAIAARSPRHLAEVPSAKRAALVGSPAPVKWWYLTEVRDRHGMPAASLPLSWAGGNAEGGGSVIPMGSDSTSTQQYNSSIISTQASRALHSAIVIIDVDAAAGATLSAVASYAALVTFAEIGYGEVPPAGSILGLFEHRDATDLSGWDKALLRSLYALPLDRRGRQQRGHLVNALASYGSLAE